MHRRYRPRTPGRFIRDVLLTLLFLLVLLFIGARLHVRHQIHAEFARIRAAGQPVILAELDLQYRDLGGRPPVACQHHGVEIQWTGVLATQPFSRFGGHHAV